jgi:hypothetical protein
MKEVRRYRIEAPEKRGNSRAEPQVALSSLIQGLEASFSGATPPCHATFLYNEFSNQAEDFLYQRKASRNIYCVIELIILLKQSRIATN